ncbi:MAG: T9SS type A sorting domain-containing protein [Cryomorphaceae bacterium]|nr:T9SS type A sorting domain-containing protein [Cryomorphaceae bacterium]
MKKVLFSLFLIFPFVSAIGQTNQPVYRLDFEFDDTPLVIVADDTLSLAWAGGIDQAQFVEIDLNLDGRLDILGFDRNGNRYIPLIKEGDSGSFYYRYDHDVIQHLPKAQNYIQTADYNCDGKMDIMTTGDIGSTTVMIYKNTSTATELRFERAVNGPYITYENDNNQQVSIYVGGSDIPVFEDINGDGSIDILAFFILGNVVIEYTNRAPCGIDFEITDLCYGKFTESLQGNNIDLQSCTYGLRDLPDLMAQANQNPEAVQHAESSLLSLDITGNGLNDLIIGDSDFPNITAAFNYGTPQSALMTAKDTLFPSYDVPGHMPNFPANFYVDVDHDGHRDLIITSNSLGNGLSDSSVHFYKNIGHDTMPIFEKVKTRLFQEDMIELSTGAFPVFADMNGDGLPDLIVGTIGYRQDTMYNWNGRLFYFENTGTSTDPEFTLVDNDFGNLAQYKFSHLYPTVFDLDNDGDLDILLGRLDGTLIYLQNTGSSSSPQFASPITNFQSIDVGFQSAPTLYDVTGDGKPELFIGSYQGTIAYYKNVGTVGAPIFQLVTNEFSGIKTWGSLDFEGNSMPSFYKLPSGEIQLIVGSFSQGVQVYDSIEDVLDMPLQTSLTFGAGSVDLNTPELSAFGSLRRNGRNQFIIKAQEITSQNIYSGRINAISFEVTSSGNPNLTQGFRISMKNIKNEDFSAGWLTPGPTVFQGNWSLNQGWNQIPFNQEAFAWDGESDILVEVCFSRNQNIFGNIDLKGTTYSEPLHAYGLNTNQSGNNTLLAVGCSLPFSNTSMTRPNVRLNMIPAVRKSNQFLKNGWRNSVALYDFDGDSLPEAVLGNASGGLQFFKGILVEVEGEPEDSLSTKVYAQPDKEKHLSLFPNPTENYFEIVYKESDMHGQNIRRVELLNVNGKFVEHWSDIKHRERIELPKLPNGVYIVRILTANGTWENHRLMIIQQ